MNEETKKLLIKIHCPFFGKTPLPDGFDPKKCTACPFLDACLQELCESIKNRRWKENANRMG